MQKEKGEREKRKEKPSEEEGREMKGKVVIVDDA